MTAASLDRLLEFEPTDRPAVTWRGRGLTYAELDEAVAALCRRLAALGAAQTNVLVLGPLSPAYVVGLLAGLRTGAVVVPVDAGMSAAQYAWIGEVTRPSVVLTSDVSTVGQHHGAGGAGELVLDAATGHVVLDVPASGRGGRGGTRDWRYSTRDAGYLIPTSGSTGDARAIVGSRAGLHMFLSWFVREFAFGQDDRCAAMTRANFDPSLRELLGVLVAGGRLCLPEVDAQLDLRALGRHLAESRPTIAFLVPSIARRVADVLRAGAVRLEDLRLAFFAGEVLPSRVVKQWARLAPGAEVVNLYGMTEGTLAQLFRRDVVGADAGRRCIPVGRPRPGVSVTIDDPDDGGLGEVLIASSAPAVGILATTSGDVGTFRVDPMSAPLRTGDIGFFDEQGELVIAGRTGNDFKIHGKRVSFDRFVDGVEDLPGVLQCVVLDRQGPQAFAAVGALAPAEEELLRDRIRDIAKRLELARPAVHLREELALLRSGKVDRVALAESIADAPQDGVATDADGGSPETVLLNLLGVGVGDAGTASMSFVDAGLTSLDMMDFVVELERRFGVRLSVQECFGLRDVSSLARVLDGRRGPSAPAPAPAASSPDGDDGVRTVPLSTRQIAYIATCMADGNANWCNISREIPIDRVVTPEEATAAVGALISRHDVLRLALAPDWSHQVHADAADLRNPVVVDEPTGVARQDDAQHRARVQEARVAAVAELLDPTAAPPIRVVVVPGSRTSSVLLVAHHLFVDGLSLDLLAGELRAVLLGQPLGEAPPPRGFRGYCLATRRAADACAADVAYWDALLHATEQVELPERSGDDARIGGLLSLPFGVTASRACHRLAADAGVSVFSVVLAAFDGAVAASFGLERLPIVIPVQVREGVPTGTLGMFMSQLVVRGTGPTSLGERAVELAWQLERGMASSAWEFDQRVEALELAGSDCFPLSTVLFNQHPGPRGLHVRDLGQWEPRSLGRALRYQLQGELQMSGLEMALTYYYRQGIAADAADAAGLVGDLHGQVLRALSSADRTVQHA